MREAESGTIDRQRLEWWQTLLLPFSLLYSGGLELYLWWRLPRQARAAVPVVSAGNLSVGGTGKTPVVIALCRHLQGQGLKVGVLSRGYGGSLSLRGGVVSDGERVYASVAEAGDEPLMIARQLPGVVVLVGKDRRKTARQAVEQFGCQVLVLDDGFQYWQLHRDVDLVLLDARCPFGNGWTLPAGILREPVPHLRRAHAVLMQGEWACDESFIRQFPSIPCFTWHKAFVGIRPLHEQPPEMSSDLNGRRVFATAGIASFDSFVETLRQVGAEIAGTWRLPDHYRYTPADVQEVQRRARECRAELVVVTEKDAVKLEEMPRMTLDPPIVVLQIEARFSDGFWRWLDARLRAASQQVAPAEGTL